jgi:hypothetical protein
MAGGRAIWVLGDELDLLGDLWSDLALPLTREDSLFLAVDARTAIEKTESGLTFVVRDLEYDLRAGWRTERRGLSVFLGRRGRALVDAAGDPHAAYLAAGFESRGSRRWPQRCASRPCGLAERMAGRVALGPVLADGGGLDADAVVFGEGHGQLFRIGRRGVTVGLDLALDALLADGRLLADASAGPRLVLPVAGGRRASFFAHYLRARNPLGVLDDAWLAGFAYEEGRSAAPSELGPPDIGGRLALGGGGERLAGELLLRFVSPAFAGGTHAVFLVDAQTLTADDVNELYYRYDLGLWHEYGGLGVGAYYYHRSNHTVDSPNDRITSTDVAEAGLETLGWHGPAQAPARRMRLDGRFRMGYLLDSSFGEDRRWHLRCGARLAFAEIARRFVPYVLAEGETGDVSNSTFAAGTTLAPHLELQLEYREDDQFFGRDQDAVLLSARYAL